MFKLTSFWSLLLLLLLGLATAITLALFSTHWHVLTALLVCFFYVLVARKVTTSIKAMKANQQSKFIGLFGLSTLLGISIFIWSYLYFDKDTTPLNSCIGMIFGVEIFLVSIYYFATSLSVIEKNTP